MSIKSRLLYSSVALLCSLLSAGLIPAAAAVVDTNNAANINSNDDDVTPASNSNDHQTIEEDSKGRHNANEELSASMPSNTIGGANNILQDPTLNSQSVVLITGAAGFIGSELALALRRTYSVKKLLLVDNLGIDSENEAAYVPPSPNSAEDRANKAIYEKLSEEELSLFEIKRQRAFRIFHELTTSSAQVDDDGGSRLNNDAESIRFYRADMRPSIPEFFDFGEVPLLEGIFQSHPDISHVVHLSDVPVSQQNQAVPRNKDSVKTGRMEGILEEFRLMLERAASQDNEEDRKVHMPQFVYASSHEVYDRISTAANGKGSPQQPNPPPFQEDKPITTPSSLHGTAKLIDEVLASAYHSTHGIYSVGLRFFPVYGPWDTPGTEVFDLAERVAALNDGIFVDDDAIYEDDMKDYVYIDDAVDAIMSAMQYRPPGSEPPPVVFNVGTGKGSTLKDLREHMVQHYPKLAQNSAAQRSAKESPVHAERLATKSFASTSRSESLLGFQPQVSPAEGLAHTLTWHRDRAMPYGKSPTVDTPSDQETMDQSTANSLAKSRGTNCSPLDRECLRGTPVFPCASECRRVERCTPSLWDDVVELSRMVTSGCDAVLYTILLDDDAEQIPSATTSAGNEDSSSYVGVGLPADIEKRTQARCNIAFVSDKSPLVQRLKSEGEEYLEDENENSGLPPLLRHGFWTVLPVPTPASSDSKQWLHAFDGTFTLEYLPKMSPGRFFGSSVRFAVYAEPSILVQNLPGLLKRMEEGPSSKNGSTALILAEKHNTCDPAQRGSTCTWARPAKNDSIQSSAYNMIRVALRGDILGGGLNPVLDSSFVMHSLREEDSRLFRCDVYGEAAQWGTSSDERAMEFIVSLHDLWSRAVSYWSGEEPWWVMNAGNNGAASEEGGDDDEENVDENRRRLLAENNGGKVDLEQASGKWMGILSSTEIQLFSFILPSEGIGIIHLDDSTK